MIDVTEKQKKMLFLSYYTLLHCLVDFCCIYYMAQVVMPECFGHSIGSWMFYVVLYNFVAFAGQLPVGILGDFIGRNHYMVIFGLCCLISAYIGTLLQMPLFPAILLLGLGNACFHVGGGRYAMEYRENACQPVGIFVATGALGVFGGNWVKGRSASWIIAITIILATALLIQVLLCSKATEKGQVKRCFSFRHNKGDWSILLAVCCILVVVLRSLAGTIFRVSWSGGLFAFLMTLGIVLGKAVGGILSDRFGIRPTVLVSLTCSALLFLGANKVPAMALLAVFLFNMTMPITLSLIGMHFPDAKGTAFGALTFAIFVGLIPSYLCNIKQFSQTWIYVLLTAASLLLLYIPLLLTKQHRGEKLHDK